MFATECSKPRTTKATTGSMAAASLSHTVLPALPIHTARQTSTLHRMPRENATTGLKDALDAAVSYTHLHLETLDAHLVD